MTGNERPPTAADVTPEAVYRDRRRFIRNAALFLGTAAGVGSGLTGLIGGQQAAPSRPPPNQGLHFTPGPYSTDEPQTAYQDVTGYNNFYEFATDKATPARGAQTLLPRPWSVVIDGEVARPQTVDIDTLLSWFPLEERIYRLRCVEAWSMVIPWLGFPLGPLLKRVEPTSRANFVAFTTLFDPRQFPGQARDVLQWPYVEGLRIDEAMHPLTLLATGLYGSALPNQNGAPLRLVVPWKYGFKSIKSIVRIQLVEQQPPTAWHRAAPHEYGFYANVNPAVDHPRWSQASERRVGDLMRRPTLPFNGYGAEVAGLYKDLDLRRNF